ncbi:hypothetical protein HF086_004338 [Spodoptera exigua]|uniref:PiggyBac transposable element-derived protein domain-containing protein n=1 Tax=Spodoptera exigua TaxID=7107 RepID=A0A922SIC4_SPOEX|nr:hypothetical protein HF086_004338 [Spodoptera exigua]
MPKRPRHLSLSLVSDHDDNEGINWTLDITVPDKENFDEFISGVSPSVPLSSNSSELDIFEHFCGNDLVEKICYFTNKYHQFYVRHTDLRVYARLKRWQDVTVHDIYIFLALTMLFTRNKRLTIEEHWSVDPLLNSPIFHSIMCRDRYCAILAVLSFSEVHDVSNLSRLYKIEMMIDHARQKFRHTLVPGGKLCIDESIVPFKGRLVIKQYLPKKRNRFFSGLPKLKPQCVIDYNKNMGSVDITDMMMSSTGKYDESQECSQSILDPTSDSQDEMNLEDVEDDHDDNEGINWTLDITVPDKENFDEFISGVSPSVPLSSDSSELDIFEHFCGNDLVEKICYFTNKYHQFYVRHTDLRVYARLKRWQDVTVHDIYIILALTMLFTRNKRLTIEEHWSVDPLLNSPIFHSIMCRDRYCAILAMLSFSEVHDVRKYDESQECSQSILDPTSDSQDEMNLEDVEDVCLPSSVAQSQLCYYVPHDGDLRSTDSTPDLFVSRGTQTLTKISSVGTQYEAISIDLISKTAKILAEKHFGTNRNMQKRTHIL